MTAYSPHQEQMLEERDNLSFRLAQLRHALDDESLQVDEFELGRMMEQRRFMTGYLETLKARIAAW